MKTRILVLVLLVVGAFSLFASGDQEPGTAGDTSEFVDINYTMMGNVPTNGQLEIVQAEWNKILKDKINASMTISWVEWADWLTKYNLLLASGDDLDLVTSGDWLDIWPNAARGAFLALDDLIPRYAPATWAEITPDQWDMCRYDGSIIAFPEESYTQWVNHGIYYRGDWANDFGIKDEGSALGPINNYMELGQYFQAIKDIMPDVIPWDVNGTNPQLFNGWVATHTDAIELLMVNTGFNPVVWARSKNSLYEAFSPVFEDTFTEFAVTMKKWGDAGYWREDVLNYKGDTRSLLKAGKSGADQHHTQTYLGLQPQMEEAIPGSDLKMFAFGTTRRNLVELPIIHGATVIHASSENPERAVMVMEQIRQNETVYRLLNYGLEGVQYEVKDGMRVRPAGYNEEKHGFYSDFWGGRVDKFEIPSETTYADYQDIYDEYNTYAIPDPYGRFQFNQKPVQAEMAAISNVTNSLGPAITYGKAGDPVMAVKQYREQLKRAGIDKVLAEINRQLSEYKQMME